MAGSSHAYWDVLVIEWRKNRDEKVTAKTRGGKVAYAMLHSQIGNAGQMRENLP